MNSKLFTIRVGSSADFGSRSSSRMGCGPSGRSPHEFVTILKTMILDGDAGSVNCDSSLANPLPRDE